MPPHPSLRDRVVIVTGGGRGIGREFVLALAGAGAKIVASARSTSDLAQVEAEVAAAAGPDRFVGVVADVRDASACGRVVAEALDAFGALHCLVNNAGVGMRHVSERFNVSPPRFWEAPVDRWRDILETNALGPFLMAHAAAPHMVQAGFGRIVNISTSPGTMVRVGYSPYGPSKAALEAMSLIWAQDLADTGVTVNVLLPGGATDTSFIPGSGPGRRGADGQLLPANVMNAALLWLLSDASNGVTGRRLVGKVWDASLPADEAAARALQPRPEQPAII
jgi:NAD(P)-dependent dehydrogenase (short-subunit alcohol dehydrogenase family)